VRTQEHQAISPISPSKSRPINISKVPFYNGRSVLVTMGKKKRAGGAKPLYSDGGITEFSHTSKVHKKKRQGHNKAESRSYYRIYIDIKRASSKDRSRVFQWRWEGFGKKSQNVVGKKMRGTRKPMTKYYFVRCQKKYAGVPKITRDA